MTAKEYLRRIRGLEFDLRRIEDDMEVYKARAEKVTTSWQSDPVQSHGEDIADKVIKYSDKKVEFEREWDKLIGERDEAYKIITQMECRDLATIIWARYIKCETWEEIAVRVKVNIRWAHRLHGRALMDFERLYKIGH